MNRSHERCRNEVERVLYENQKSSDEIESLMLEVMIKSSHNCNDAKYDRHRMICQNRSVCFEKSAIVIFQRFTVVHLRTVFFSETFSSLFHPHFYLFFSTFQMFSYRHLLTVSLNFILLQCSFLLTLNATRRYIKYSSGKP